MKPLDGPRAKVKRAKSQIVTLEASFERLFKLYPYSVVVAEFDRKAGHYHLRIQDGPSSFPDEWGVLIGEIAHNLRSALDLLVWQLALLSNPNPSDRTEFLIYLIGYTKRRFSGGNKIPCFHRDGLNKIRSIDKRFYTRIEAFQPYKRGNKGCYNPLFLLHKLNNADKHRLITVLTTVVGGITFTGHVGGGSKFNVGMPIHTNANVGYVNPLPSEGIQVLDIRTMKIKIIHEMQVNLDVTPGIRFGDGCDAVKRLPVVPTLNSILNEVSRIIESFASEFE